MRALSTRPSCWRRRPASSGRARSAPALALLVGVLYGTACASAPAEAERTPGVYGRVVFEGEVPEPVRVPYEDLMREATGESEFVSRLWLVGPEGGLANCAISLHPLDAPQAPAVEPMTGVVLDKFGPYYLPQLLVVTTGTEVELRNERSPCRGFHLRCKKNMPLNLHIYGESTSRWLAERAEAVYVSCDVRPYTHGAILVVDTPYHALTDAEGRFAIEGVAPGSYRLRAYHEELRTWIRDRTVAVEEGGVVSLQLRASLQAEAGSPRRGPSRSAP